MLLVSSANNSWCQGTTDSCHSFLQKADKMPDFNAAIISIDAKIVDLTWPGGLFEYEEFRNIYVHPEMYKAEALAALNSQALTEQQKIIVALSMQNLELSNFLVFSREVLSLLEKGTISQAVFDWAVFPSYDWNTKWVDNRTAVEVQQILAEISNSKSVSEEKKKYIQEEIITGMAEKQVLYLREIGQIK
ncbi:MAG TPA: hypothetical protein DC064_09395 [Cyanobacteria bacterium UBA9273]|nr:hypothetical protein [Cyanobacteria bacterium UBA9273]